MSVTLGDLLNLPPSSERDDLIDRERWAIRARYEERRVADASALDVAETTRWRAKGILRNLPSESKRDCEMRRGALLLALDSWGKRVPIETKTTDDHAEMSA